MAQLSWVLGYLSGWAMSSGKEIIQGVDNASISLWITNYCHANPLDDVADAGYQLGNTILKRKGL